MRLPCPALIAALACALACEGCGERGEAPGADAGPGPSSSSALAPEAEAGPGAAASEGDPYASFEGLRPRARASWPVENVDISRYAGWRIDPSSGGFAYEPGLVFATAADAFVLAIADGEVVGVERDAEDELRVTIDHGDGIRSRYGPVAEALVHAGMPVGRGVAIALAEPGGLRLETLVDEVPIDPALVIRQPLHRWPARLFDPPRPPSPDQAAAPGSP